jgi:hypothetical protein
LKEYWLPDEHYASIFVSLAWKGGSELKGMISDRCPKLIEAFHSLGKAGLH